MLTGANITKVFTMRPRGGKRGAWSVERGEGNGQSSIANRQSSTTAGEVEDALGAEIFRVTKQRPCAGCGP